MKKDKLVDITLTKTILLSLDNCTSEINLKLYQSLYKRLEKEMTSFQYREKGSLYERIKRDYSSDSFDTYLTNHTKSYIIDERYPKQSVLCRNKKEIELNHSKTKLYLDDEKKNFYFVLFYESYDIVYLNQIGNEILVTPASKLGEIFHVDLSDKSLSISYVALLNVR